MKKKTLKHRALIRRWFVPLTVIAATAGCSLIAGLSSVEGSKLAPAKGDGSTGETGVGDGGDAQKPPIDWGKSWCGSHHDDGTLFCNDFDNGTGELALDTANPPGPWSNQQQGAGGFSEGLSLNCMPNSPLSSFNVTADVLPKDVSTILQLITTQPVPTTPLTDPVLGSVNSPTGVVLTFDLHVDGYYSGSQDLSIARIGSHDGDNPQLASWWVSLDYNTNVMQMCEFGIQTPGSPATVLQCPHSPTPDFSIAGWYHCSLAVDLVLGYAWWTFDDATITAIDAGPVDEGGVDAGDDASDDGGAVGNDSGVFPLVVSKHEVLKAQPIYFQGSTWPAVLPNSGTSMDIIVGLNYAINLGTQTGLYFDNVRVEAVPPEGLPTGPVFPTDADGGL